jgi:hypothetical protein
MIVGMDVAISLLGFSGIITASILKFVPSRGGKNGNGDKYVSIREFDKFAERIERKLDGMEMLLKSLR